MTVQELESLLKRTLPMNNQPNDPKGLQRRFGIKDTMNKIWDCNDRAEYAKKLAEANGYKAEYGYQRVSKTLGHRTLKITDKNGVVTEILRYEV